MVLYDLFAFALEMLGLALLSILLLLLHTCDFVNAIGVPKLLSSSTSPQHVILPIVSLVSSIRPISPDTGPPD